MDSLSDPHNFHEAAGYVDNASSRMRILDVPVDVTTISDTVDRSIFWASEQTPRMVFVREVASLMAAKKEPVLKSLHEDADLVVPDGMPLVWIGKRRNFGAKIGRVSGADLLDALCAKSLEAGQSHFFFGGKPGVADLVISRLLVKYPNLNIAGSFCPPMRDIGPNFTLTGSMLAEIETIRETKADFIWVGLSSPKQEYWMSAARHYIGRGVMFGVGAAFDFHAGTITRAPIWMQKFGLEWLHRFVSEPRRLWRRYLLLAPHFVVLASIEEILHVFRPSRRS